MAATTQVQILVRTNSAWEELGAWSFGQCPWACLQGQLAHDRLTEMLEPLGFPVNDQRAPDWTTGCWLGASRKRRVCARFSCGQWPQCAGTLDSNSFLTCGASLISSPHRLVVAATTQVQILVRTSISLRDLGVRRFGQCPWGCLQGQLAHDRLTEMLEPLGSPVSDQRAPD